MPIHPEIPYAADLHTVADGLAELAMHGVKPIASNKGASTFIGKATVFASILNFFNELEIYINAKIKPSQAEKIDSFAGIKLDTFLKSLLSNEMMARFSKLDCNSQKRIVLYLIGLSAMTISSKIENIYLSNKKLVENFKKNLGDVLYRLVDITIDQEKMSSLYNYEYDNIHDEIRFLSLGGGSLASIGRDPRIAALIIIIAYGISIYNEAKRKDMEIEIKKIDDKTNKFADIIKIIIDDLYGSKEGVMYEKSNQDIDYFSYLTEGFTNTYQEDDKIHMIKCKSFLHNFSEYILMKMSSEIFQRQDIYEDELSAVKQEYIFWRRIVDQNLIQEQENPSVRGTTWLGKHSNTEAGDPFLTLPHSQDNKLFKEDVLTEINENLRRSAETHGPS